MTSPNTRVSSMLAQSFLVGGATLALAGLALAGGECDLTCGGGQIASDGCEVVEFDSNGGCNTDAANPPYDFLGTINPGNPVVTYCGQVGTHDTDPGTRDLDWATFTLDQPAFITISASHQVVATGLPAPNFTIFLRDGSVCATAVNVIALASGVCPFVPPTVLLPAGTHTLILTVNAFGADGPLCPVDYVTTISATFGGFASCGEPDAGECAEANGTPGCDDFACCETVCAFFSPCCDIAWDAKCAEFAIELCGIFVYDCPDAPGAPANDCVSDSIQVFTDSVVFVDTTNATTDGPDQAQCNSAENDTPIHKDVWYHWIATGDGNFTASNCLLAEFDSKIAIYDLGTDLPSAIDPQTLPNLFIACNEDCADNATFFTSELSVPVTGGNTYLVRLGGFLGEAGPGDLAFSFAGFPEPDTCTDLGTDPLTQSTNLVPTAQLVACAGGGITTVNQWARSFDLSAGPTAGEDYIINCVEFGYGNTGPDLVGTINVYVDNDGGVPTAPGTDLDLIGSRSVGLPNSAVTTLFAAFEEPICVPANSVIVVELDIPAQTAGSARAAGNALGQSGPTYLRSSACGINAFVTTESIGFPNNHWVLVVNGSIGCEGDPGTPCPADLNGSGSVDGADLGILLVAWGPNPGSPADFNGDGVVDGADLGILLVAWGPCPE